MGRACRRTQGRPDQARAMLQESATAELADYFEFLLRSPSEELDGAPQGGNRYPVEARMDGREFARFHVDIGIDDNLLEPLDVLKGRDWLDIGGIAAPSFPAISCESAIRRKASRVYSAARNSTQYKDERPVQPGPIDTARKARRRQTEDRDRYDIRDSRDARVSEDFDFSPAAWEPVFAEMAKDCELDLNMAQGFEMVQTFLSSL